MRLVLSSSSNVNPFVRAMLLTSFAMLAACGEGDDGAPPDSETGGAPTSGGTSASGGSSGAGDTSGGGDSGNAGDEDAGGGGRTTTGGNAGGAGRATGGSAGDGGATDDGGAPVGGSGGGDSGGSATTGGMAGVGGSGGAGGGGPMCGSGRISECFDDADCDRMIGARGCGAWDCRVGECHVVMRCDDADGDGFGSGPDCACLGEALDCDDGDPDVADTASVGCCNGGTRACVDGVWGLCSAATGETCDGVDNDCNGAADDLGVFTCGFGACKKTVAACSGGVLGVCVPDAPTTNVDACDGIDEDCDGAIDEDCADCIHVAPDGDDALAAANCGSTAFRSVQAAIDFADTHRDVSNRVCVAAGPTCGATATYAGPPGADLTMREGISLLGNYESTTWSRCSNSTTTLAPQTARGVVFPPTVAVETVLDGFAVYRVHDVRVAGVTVDGARGAVLSNLGIPPGDPGGQAPAQHSAGVSLVNGALAVVIRSRFENQRAIASFAVHAVDSTVFVEDNCPAEPSVTTGRCASACGGTGPQILAEIALENANGSRVQRNALCGTALEDVGNYRRRGMSVGGGAAGIVIRANLVTTDASPTGGRFPVGLAFEECGGDAPWIVDNESITAVIRSSFGTFDNVRATGDCHPVIESNGYIGNTIQTLVTHDTAVACSGGTKPSRCVIAKNAEIRGGYEPGGSYSPGQQTSGTGVACRNGSCARIEENRITGLRTEIICSGGACLRLGQGMTLDGGAPFVLRNTISAGSGPGMRDYARFAAGSSTGATNGRFANNRIDSFLGSALEFEWNEIGDVRWQGGGRLRDNCFGAFRENGAAADPLVFESNSFSSYFDELTTSLTAAQVNALTDMITSGNDSTWPCTRPVGP